MADPPVDPEGSVEQAVIEALAARLGPPPPGEIWIGDDAAVVRPPAGALLLAVDTVVAGVHADLSLVGIDDLGWKAVAVNVSDIAAMGGRPLHSLVSVAAPAGVDIARLYDGLTEAARAYGCPIVGGDLTSSRQVMVTVSVTGETTNGRPVLRSGAAPGDLVWVSGALGASAAGLSDLRAGRRDGTCATAHRRPQARLREGQAAAAAGATAMIDVSDGLSIDLWRIGRASGVAIELTSVPVHPGATRVQALGGGEDYELAFTAPPGSEVAARFAQEGLRPPVCLGRCLSGPPGRLSLEGRPLPVTGWQHWS